MDNKEKYVPTDIEIIHFTTEDIFTISEFEGEMP